MDYDNYFNQIGNPNLYVTLPDTERNGYLLQESGSQIYLEDGSNLFT